MKKSIFFVVGIFVCFFLLLGCENLTTDQPTTLAPTTLAPTTLTPTTLATTLGPTTAMTTVMPPTTIAPTTMPPTTVPPTTETPTTVVTAPLPSEAEILSLITQADLDLTQINGSFVLPRTIGNFTLKWTFSDNPYWEATETTDQVMVEVFDVALGDHSQYVDFSVSVRGDGQQARYEFYGMIPARTMPIVDFYSMSDGQSVRIGGVVYAIARVDYSGYYIHDQTGCVFVYASSDDVALGDEIIINGTKSIYYNLHEVIYDSIDDVTFLRSGLPGPEYTSSSVSEILSGAKDHTSLSRNVTIEAKVVRKYENYMTNFYFQDIITGEDVFIYYQSAQDIAGLYDGQYVEANITVYDYNDQTGTFSVFLSNNVNDIREITPNLSDEEKALAVSYYLQHLYDEKLISDNVDLVLTDLNWSSTISWSSENPEIVSPTGVVVLQDEQVDVVLTAMIEVGTAELETEVTLKISPINIESLQEIALWQIANQTSTKEVAFEAIVVATRGTSGYFVVQNGHGYYVKGNDINVQPGDLVRLVGQTKYSKQPYIDSKRLQKVLSSDNPIPEPLAYSASALALQTIDDSFYNTYITLEGQVKGTSTQYGFTYSLEVGDRIVSIHSASNTAGFSYLIGSRIRLTCFVNRINPDLTSWELFVVNRDGDIIVLESAEAKLQMGVDYLDDIFPETGVVSADLRLPPFHPAVIDVTYTYHSSNETVLSSEGKYLFPQTDVPITFSVDVEYDGLKETITYEYTIKGTLEGNASDLMFSFLLHGITNNKLFAIYNGTGADVDLSAYRVMAIQNTGIGSNNYTIDGRNVVGLLHLTGTLADGETIIIYHSSATVVIMNQIPATTRTIATPNTNGVAQFNGKDGDMLVLQRDGMVIDQIGSFEKINSQGGSTSWETEFFGQKMLIRISSQPSPALDWSNFDSIYAHWAVFPAGDAPDYILPAIAWDFKNNDLPDTQTQT
jgi:hypothetical protein